MIAVHRRRLALLAPLACLLALACVPKHYVLLSPEDNYSDDGTLVVKVDQIVEAQKGRTEVQLAVQNKTGHDLSLADVQASLIDGDEKPQPLLAKPSEPLAADTARTLVYAFDTTAAAKGALEMHLDVPGVKVWPIIFSTEKPADFKATPTPPDQGPGGPAGGGMPGGGGSPY